MKKDVSIREAILTRLPWASGVCC